MRENINISFSNVHGHSPAIISKVCVWEPSENSFFICVDTPRVKCPRVMHVMSGRVSHLEIYIGDSTQTMKIETTFLNNICYEIDRYSVNIWVFPFDLISTVEAVPVLEIDLNDDGTIAEETP